MSKSNEDRLQEAIVDALDSRAIAPMYNWRHPLPAPQALAVLIEMKQLSAIRRAGEIAKEQGYEQVAYWLIGYELGLEAGSRVAKEE